MRFIQVLHHQVVADDGPVWAVAGVDKDARCFVCGNHNVTSLPHPSNEGAWVDDRSTTLEGKLVTLKHQLTVRWLDLKHREL